MVYAKAAYHVAKKLISIGISAGKFTSGKSTFVKYFPPNLRPYARDALTGAGIVLHGGLIGDVIQETLDGFSQPTFVTQTNKQYKKRGGYQFGYSSGNRYGSFYSNRNKRFKRCPTGRRRQYPKRRYC